MRNTERVAGVAAISAAAVYLIQPLLVALNGAEEQGPLPAEVRDSWWAGAAQAVALGGVGVALLVLVIALGLVLRERIGPLSAGQQAGQALGVLGAAGWLVAAAVSLAGFSTVAAGIADSGADEAAQRAALDVVWVVLTAGLELASIGLAGWLAMISTVGRRAGLVGRPLAAAGLLVALVMLVTSLVVVPAGLLLLIPYLTFLGVRLLRRARTAADPVLAGSSAGSMA